MAVGQNVSDFIATASVNLFTTGCNEIFRYISDHNQLKLLKY